MTGNQTMDYYVRSRHLYSHSRTCTCSRLCRRPSTLVAFHICYLLDRASIHEISALVTWFQCMSDIFSHYGYLDPLYIFTFMEIMIFCISSSSRFWSIYIVRGEWPHMSYFVSCLFMAIVLLCIWDCHMYLQSYAKIFVLYCWMVGSSTWFFVTPVLGWTYNVFRPSYHPSDLTH